MDNQAPPTFEEWVNYCFTHGLADFHRENPYDDEEVQARQVRFLGIELPQLTSYLTRLFESPSFIAERYTDDQIAEATWFIFGCGSEFIGDVRRGALPADLQIRCVRSITTIYTDLFDRVCGRRGVEPDSDLSNTVAVDCAVYMMWDMDQLAGMAMFPWKGPHLVEPAIEVLESVLDRCRTSACRLSALHGIGHIYGIHDHGGDQAIAARLRAAVDRFMKREDLPAWLREYASDARDGCVA